MEHDTRRIWYSKFFYLPITRQRFVLFIFYCGWEAANFFFNAQVSMGQSWRMNLLKLIEVECRIYAAVH